MELQRRHRTQEVANRIYDDNMQLNIRVKEYSDTANYLLGRINICFQELDRMLPIFQQLKAEVVDKASGVTCRGNA